MKKKKAENRYKKVREVSEIAKKKQAVDRDPIVDSTSQYIKTINDTSKKRHYVLEAMDELKEKKKDDENAE